MAGTGFEPATSRL